MRLFARRDALLLVGLTAALLIIFAAPISRLLDYIRDIERRSGVALLPALVVLTVSVFKGVNDRYGHLCGDAVLAAVGQRMRDVLRPT